MRAGKCGSVNDIHMGVVVGERGSPKTYAMAHAVIKLLESETVSAGTPTISRHISNILTFNFDI